VETIPGETPAKIALEEDPSSQGAFSQGAPQMENTKNSDSDVLRISFSDKSVLSSIFPTFSPRLPKSRNVKIGQKHPDEHDLVKFVFSLKVLAEAWNQREVKNDE
jgi:hypothetical protein